MVTKKQANYIKLAAVGFVILVFSLTIILVVQFIKIGNLKSKQNNLNNNLASIEQSIIDYTGENAYLKSPDFLEDYAREVLGWGKNGEIIFK